MGFEANIIDNFSHWSKRCDEYNCDIHLISPSIHFCLQNLWIMKELLSLSWTYTLCLFALVLNYYISTLTLIKFLYSHFPYTKSPGMRFINKKLHKVFSLINGGRPIFGI